MSSLSPVVSDDAEVSEFIERARVDTQGLQDLAGMLAVLRRVEPPARTAFPQPHREGGLGHLFSPGKFSLKPGFLVADMGILQGLFKRVDGGDADFFRVENPEPLFERPGT